MSSMPSENRLMRNSELRHPRGQARRMEIMMGNLKDGKGRVIGRVIRTLPDGRIEFEVEPGLCCRTAADRIREVLTAAGIDMHAACRALHLAGFATSIAPDRDVDLPETLAALKKINAVVDFPSDLTAMELRGRLEEIQHILWSELGMLRKGAEGSE